MQLYGCEWNVTSWLIFSDNVGPLIYYSHLAPLVASLVLGVAVLLNNPRGLINRTLFFVTLMFATYCYFDLILWASPSPEHVIFFWASIVPIELLIYASSLYLVYLFSNNQKDIPLSKKITIAVFFIPIIALLHTKYNLLGLSPDCDEGAIEGPLIQYLYFVEFLYLFWIAAIVSKGYFRIRDVKERRQFLYIGVGVLIFLGSFSAGNIILMLSLETIYDQYKLFGMPVFIAFITYSAVRFRTFNLKIFTAQALVIALALLVFALLFLDSLQTVRIVTGITFILVCALGYILIKNVHREILQRELIEAQEKDLQVINRQQENLLAFISHEVKGYLAKSAASYAGILQGDYGKIPEPLMKMADSGLIDMRKGVDMVGDILDASNLRRGTVSYDKREFDLKKSIEEVIHDLKAIAQKKGVTLEFAASAGTYLMRGDEAKMRRHVIRNLVENSIHYTPSGSITVSLSRNPDMIHFSVKDTGVGITKEDMQNLFTEGGHGKESTKVNVDSTGYGLFIAKQVTEAHGGTIRADSKGKGKGSEFVVELPLS